jgi:hypothetical protein
LYILGKQGKIARMEGLDYLKSIPEVFHLSQEKKEGDEIGPDGTSAQKVIGIHLKMKHRNDLDRIMQNIQREFHLYDENGNDLTVELMK